MNSLYCFQLDKNYSSVWGARAIYDSKTGEIDFLSDRVTILNQENFEPLKAWLRKEGLKEIRKIIKKASLKESSSETLIHTTATTPQYVIKATPNGSYGYMYLIAHPVEGEKFSDQPRESM